MLTPRVQTAQSLMKHLLDIGDSRDLPITTRAKGDMIELRYERGDALVRAFSLPYTADDATHKERARQLIRDWLTSMEIPRKDVDIEGEEEDAEDYHKRFHAWAVVKAKHISIFVPGFDDPWWDEKKKRAGITRKIEQGG